MTLQRYCKKYKDMGSIPKIGYSEPRIVFSKDKEDRLVSYILKAASIHMGLTPKEIRTLAYEYAKANDIKCPSIWISNEIAGEEWFSKFMKRNTGLSLRTPELTSLSRATSFNKTNINCFFDNLSRVLEQYKFESKDIYNCDETGITTVQKPNCIIGPKGAKQIGALNSPERGTLVTMCLAVNANGISVPPMLVFPRVQFRDHFITNGPPGCCGSANPSEWMQSEDFLLFLQHFAKHTRCSKDRPVLLTGQSSFTHIISRY